MGIELAMADYVACACVRAEAKGLSERYCEI